MHFTKTILSLVAVGSAIAFPTLNVNSKRDAAVIQGEVTKIKAALTSLSTAITGLSAADPNSAAPILTASNNAGDVIKAATTTIQASDPLSITDALSLQATAGELTTAVEGIVDSLVEKKPELDQLGVTSVAVQTLQAQKTDSDALGQVIVSKVPAIGQGIAQNSIGAISQAIDEGITALQGTPATGVAPPALSPAPVAIVA